MEKIAWFKYSSPSSFYFLAGRLIPWFAGLATVLTVAGLYIGFFMAPTDFQQGEAYRIIFIHVPAAWMSMFIAFGQERKPCCRPLKPSMKASL